MTADERLNRQSNILKSMQDTVVFLCGSHEGTDDCGYWNCPFELLWEIFSESSIADLYDREPNFDKLLERSN